VRHGAARALLLCCQPPAPPAAAVQFATSHTSAVHVPPFLAPPPPCCSHLCSYTYLNLDDGWSERERGADGRLAANKAAFPSGMKALGDYIHEKGLQFGIYGDAGRQTCAKFAGEQAGPFVGRRLPSTGSGCTVRCLLDFHSIGCLTGWLQDRWGMRPWMHRPGPSGVSGWCLLRRCRSQQRSTCHLSVPAGWLFTPHCC
jgi:hypothetical protein